MDDQSGSGGAGQHLVRAYLATAYTAGEVAICIGRRSAAADALLARLGTRTGVLITAWNPMSKRMPAGWNRRAQRRLEDRLRRWRWLPAIGRWHRWQEAHLLVAADQRPMLRLARLFRQLAVVVVAVHRPARLVFLPAGGGIALGRISP
jgi:Protein of unknown function (DUF3293)